MSAAPDLTPVTRIALLRNATVRKALALLLEGHDCAQDLKVSPWEFATEAPVLLALGCTPHSLHWLLRKGYVQQAVPTTRSRRGRRCPRGQGGKPSGQAGFILTELGAAIARGIGSLAAAAEPGDSPCRVRVAHRPETPAWDHFAGELWFQSRLVKRFRNAASNQRAILDAFQSRLWPPRVDDPLPWPEQPSIKLKARLHDAIKNLNRDQTTRCLHFYGTDAGRGVGWRPLA
jgi:hypothetical protein